MCSVCGVIR